MNMGSLARSIDKALRENLGFRKWASKMLAYACTGQVPHELETLQDKLKELKNKQ